MIIDNEEFEELESSAETEKEVFGDRKINPYSGKPAKFHMDKFFGKDMKLSQLILSPEKSEEWLNWLTESLPKQFKRNPSVFEYSKDTRGKPEPIPLAFHDTEFMNKVLASVEIADNKMKDNEKLSKDKRKERLKIFHNSLLLFLNNQCGSNYKLDDKYV